MISKSSTIEEYISQLPEDRIEFMETLRNVIKDNLPAGFHEEMSYGMIGYVVPFSIYPSGYHCNTKLPLPFMNIASQKNFIAIYHMGLYADPFLNSWFLEEYPKFSSKKLDMGKSCLRFKKGEDIPFELIGMLVQKMSPTDWIAMYEKLYKK